MGASDSHADLTKLVEALVCENRTKIITIHETVEDVAKDVASLARILRDGNGTPPLTVRMALVEKMAADTVVLVQGIKQQTESAKETSDGRKWQVVCMCIATILSFISTMVAALLAAGIKPG